MTWTSRKVTEGKKSALRSLELKTNVTMNNKKIAIIINGVVQWETENEMCGWMVKYFLRKCGKTWKLIHFVYKSFDIIITRLSFLNTRAFL